MTSVKKVAWNEFILVVKTVFWNKESTEKPQAALPPLGCNMSIKLK